MFTQLTISEAEADMFRICNTMSPPEAGKIAKKHIWQAIRTRLNIPADVRLKVDNDGTIINAETGRALGTTPNDMGFIELTRVKQLAEVENEQSERGPMPVTAVPIGGGLYVHGGKLYFPLSE